MRKERNKNGALLKGLLFCAVCENPLRQRTEYSNLINLTTGTATFTMARDANNSFSMLIQKMGFSVAELGNTDGIVTLQITGVQLYDATNGLVTMTIITPLTGICQ